MSKLLELPPGAAGGVLSGSQTMSAAIGTAEMAVEQGAYKIPAGTTAEQVTAATARAIARRTHGEVYVPWYGRVLALASYPLPALTRLVMRIVK